MDATWEIAVVNSPAWEVNLRMGRRSMLSWDLMDIVVSRAAAKSAAIGFC